MNFYNIPVNSTSIALDGIHHYQELILNNKTYALKKKLILDKLKMVRYDGLLDPHHSKDCSRLTHPT